MTNWISIEDQLPEHGQHVLVWEDRFNVYPFPRDHPGDDGEGRIRMGDAIYHSGQHEWDMKEDKSPWNNSSEEYKSMNYWDRWKGHGPCSFDNVTYWQPLPKPPTKYL